VDKDKEIIKRIKKSKVRLDDGLRHAILVKENPIFMKEFNEIRKDLGEDFFYNFYYEESSFSDEEGEKWFSFQEKWGVKIIWFEDDGFVFQRNWPVEANLVLTPNKTSRGHINIKINGRIRLEDIKEIWPAIKKIQKEIIGDKSKKKTKFSRDLCWYELNKNFGLSSREILKYWTRIYPDDFDLIIISKMLNNKFFLKKVRSLKKFKGKKTDKYFINELLEYIRNEKQSEIKEAFDEEKKFYLTGRIGDKKFTPKAQSVIKSGINRIKKDINKSCPSGKGDKEEIIKPVPFTYLYRNWNK